MSIYARIYDDNHIELVTSDPKNIFTMQDLDEINNFASKTIQYVPIFFGFLGGKDA